MSATIEEAISQEQKRLEEDHETVRDYLKSRSKTFQELVQVKEAVRELTCRVLPFNLPSTSTCSVY